MYIPYKRDNPYIPAVANKAPYDTDIIGGFSEVVYLYIRINTIKSIKINSAILNKFVIQNEDNDIFNVEYIKAIKCSPNVKRRNEPIIKNANTTV